MKTSRNNSLFYSNAWTPYQYNQLRQNLYIRTFEVERRTAYNLAVQVFLLTFLPPIVWRTYTTEYDEFFGGSDPVSDPIGGYVDATRRLVDNGASFGGLFAGELVLQTLVASDAQGLVYTFDSPIRGKVRIRISTEAGDCFDPGA